MESHYPFTILFFIFTVRFSLKYTKYFIVTILVIYTSRINLLFIFDTLLLLCTYVVVYLYFINTRLYTLYNFIPNAITFISYFVRSRLCFIPSSFLFIFFYFFACFWILMLFFTILQNSFQYQCSFSWK